MSFNPMYLEAKRKTGGENFVRLRAGVCSVPRWASRLPPVQSGFGATTTYAEPMAETEYDEAVFVGAPGYGLAADGAGADGYQLVVSYLSPASPKGKPAYALSGPSGSVGGSITYETSRPSLRAASGPKRAPSAVYAQPHRSVSSPRSGDSARGKASGGDGDGVYTFSSSLGEATEEPRYALATMLGYVDVNDESTE